MNKIKDYTILFFLAVIFVMIFKYSQIIKLSILGSLSLWVKNLIPSMLPMFIVLDLALNYGLLELSYKFFKNNTVILTAIALLSGCPTNVKYIKEFYEEGLISKSTANFMLMFAYSPNPLFIIAFSPSKWIAGLILLSIYLTDFFIFLIFKPQFELSSSPTKNRPHSSFIDCLSCSIAKSCDILILILGVVVVYGVLNSILNLWQIDSLFISSILELTNALAICTQAGFPLFWAMFACLFAGLSIHTQIKSILENTDISYRYFLTGRLCASVPVLILALLN